MMSSSWVILKLYRFHMKTFFKTSSFYFLLAVMMLILSPHYVLTLAQYMNELFGSTQSLGPVATFYDGVLNSYVYLVHFLLLFLCPLFSLRMINRRKTLGLWQPMQQLPIRDSEHLLGLYFTSMTILKTVLFLSLSLPFMTLLLGPIGLGQLMSAYIGLVLLGSFYCSVSLMVGFLLHSQILSFISSFLLCLLLWFSGSLEQWFESGVLQAIFSGLNIEKIFYDFSLGLLSLKGVLLLLSYTLFTLMMSYLVLKIRRIW